MISLVNGDESTGLPTVFFIFTKLFSKETLCKKYPNAEFFLVKIQEKYGLQKTLYLNIFRAVRETYEEFCQASNLELFAKLVNGLTAQSRFCVRL